MIAESNREIEFYGWDADAKNSEISVVFRIALQDQIALHFHFHSHPRSPACTILVNGHDGCLILSIQIKKKMEKKRKKSRAERQMVDPSSE